AARSAVSGEARRRRTLRGRAPFGGFETMLIEGAEEHARKARRLRSDRRLPHRRAGLTERIDRLVLRAPLRLTRLLRQAARDGGERVLAAAPARPRAPRGAALPRRDAGARDGDGDRRGLGGDHRLHAPEV